MQCNCRIFPSVKQYIDEMSGVSIFYIERDLALEGNVFIQSTLPNNVIFSNALFGLWRVQYF